MSKVQTSCSLPPETVARLNQVATVRRCSLARVMAEAIEMGLPKVEADLMRPPVEVARQRAAAAFAARFDV